MGRLNTAAKLLTLTVIGGVVAVTPTIVATVPAEAVSSQIDVVGKYCVRLDDSSQSPQGWCPGTPGTLNLNADGRRMWVPPGYCSHTGDKTNVCVHSKASKGEWDYFGWKLKRNVSLGKWY